jgi:C4-dicarboxylate transporter
MASLLKHYFIDTLGELMIINTYLDIALVIIVIIVLIRQKNHSSKLDDLQVVNCGLLKSYKQLLMSIDILKEELIQVRKKK